MDAAHYLDSGREWKLPSPKRGGHSSRPKGTSAAVRRPDCSSRDETASSKRNIAGGERGSQEVKGTRKKAGPLILKETYRSSKAGREKCAASSRNNNFR